jgi:hypothetical protein
MSQYRDQINKPPLHINHIAAIVTKTAARVLGRMPVDPESNPVLHSVRAGQARLLAEERATRDAAAASAGPSHFVRSDGRVVPTGPIPDVPAGPYRDWLLSEDESADVSYPASWG